MTIEYQILANNHTVKDVIDRLFDYLGYDLAEVVIGWHKMYITLSNGFRLTCEYENHYNSFHAKSYYNSFWLVGLIMSHLIGKNHDRHNQYIASIAEPPGRVWIDLLNGNKWEAGIEFYWLDSDDRSHFGGITNSDIGSLDDGHKWLKETLSEYNVELT